MATGDPQSIANWTIAYWSGLDSTSSPGYTTLTNRGDIFSDWYNETAANINKRGDCAYCGRHYDKRPDSGHCVSCGAPLRCT
jgi:hypothetical protein